MSTPFVPDYFKPAPVQRPLYAPPLLALPVIGSSAPLYPQPPQRVNVSMLLRMIAPQPGDEIEVLGPWTRDLGFKPE